MPICWRSDRAWEFAASLLRSASVSLSPPWDRSLEYCAVKLERACRIETLMPSEALMAWFWAIAASMRFSDAVKIASAWDTSMPEAPLPRSSCEKPLMFEPEVLESAPEKTRFEKLSEPLALNRFLELVKSELVLPVPVAQRSK